MYRLAMTKFVRSVFAVKHAVFFPYQIIFQDTNLAGGKYNIKDENFYCEKDFIELFSPRCKACDKPLVGETMKINE